MSEYTGVEVLDCNKNIEVTKRVGAKECWCKNVKRHAALVQSCGRGKSNDEIV